MMSELKKNHLDYPLIRKEIKHFPQTYSFLTANWPQLITLLIKGHCLVLWMAVAGLEPHPGPPDPGVELGFPRTQGCEQLSLLRRAQDGQVCEFQQLSEDLRDLWLVPC